MNRTVYIIRHAKSLGNRRNRATFGVKGAGLSVEGVNTAKKLKKALADLGIDANKEPVAVSELIRTRQTAEQAGFKRITTTPLLNEVDSGLQPDTLDRMLLNKAVPKAAIAAAKKLLKHPPAEQVWVTHGLLIAGLAHELNIPVHKLFVPEMASITTLTIPS